jgi:hypothetical protein
MQIFIKFSHKYSSFSAQRHWLCTVTVRLLAGFGLTAVRTVLLQRWQCDCCLCQHLCTDRQQQRNLWTAAWQLFVSTSVYWQTAATERVDSCVTAVCINTCVLTDSGNRTYGQLRDGCLCQHLCTDKQQQQNLWTAAIVTKIFRAFRLRTGPLL